MVAHILQKSLDLTAALKFLHILNTVKFNLDQPMGVGSFKVIIRANSCHLFSDQGWTNLFHPFQIFTFATQWIVNEVKGFNQLRFVCCFMGLVAIREGESG